MNRDASKTPRSFFASFLTLRQNMTRRIVVAGLLLGGLGGAVAVGRRVFEPLANGQPPANAPLPVAVFEVRQVSSFNLRRTFTGVLEPKRQSSLSFEAAGQVVSVLVDEGDRVRQGDTLARLDSRRLEAKRRELEAERRAADATLRELRQGPRPQTLEAARAEVAQLQADHALQKANLVRSHRLLADNGVSQASHEAAVFGEQAAAARLDAARHRLDELEAGTRIEQVEAQQALVNQLDAALENVALDIEKSTLRAPFDGCIVERFVDEGTVISPGQPLLRLLDPQLQARIGVPPQFAAAWAAGDSQTLVAEGKSFVGHVDSILPELDPRTRTQTVIFEVPASSQSGGVAAQLVQVEVEQQRDVEGFWAPLTALNRGSRGLWAAYQVRGDEADQRIVKCDVEVLHTQGDRARFAARCTRAICSWPKAPIAWASDNAFARCRCQAKQTRRQPTPVSRGSGGGLAAAATTEAAAFLRFSSQVRTLPSSLAMPHLTLLFLKSPRLLALSLGLILVSGLSSFYLLPRMEDPLLTPRVAIVNTLYPGADPERVESLVTEVLEEELREIEQIKELRSTSRANVSTVTIELMDSVTDPEPIWSRIRDKVNDAAASLPPEAAPPVFDSLEVRAYALIVALHWSSDQPVSYAVLRRLAEELEERLKAAPGTEKVDVFGEPDEEFLVTVEPEQLTSRGISIDQVMQQIRQSDAKVAAGQLRGDSGEIQFEVSGELDTLARLSDTPIVFGSQQQSLRLGDIATISKGIVDPPESIAWIGGRRGVALGVLVRNNTRIDHWTEQAENVLAFDKELPSGIELVEVFQQNRYVSERLASLLGNLLIGGLAVVVVVFWLMGWRSALIVGAALPLSALMVLSGLRFMEIPIHQMSVTGLILALGLLIDNAIVMVDDVRGRLRIARRGPGGQRERASSGGPLVWLHLDHGPGLRADRVDAGPGRRVRRVDRGKRDAGDRQFLPVGDDRDPGADRAADAAGR